MKMNFKLLKVVFVTFLFLFSIIGFASAAVLPEIVVESFDYAEGSLGQQGAASHGWAAAWDSVASGSVDIISGDMEFPIISSTGNYINVTEGGTIFRNLADKWPDDAGAYWISLLYQRTDSIDVDDSYNGFSLFLDETELLYIGKPWGTKNLGLDGTGVENVPSEVDAYEGGWLVIKLMMSGDAENDDAYLWINPDPSVEPDTANADAHVGWKGSNGFNRIRIASGNTPNQAECAIDEIRITQSFSNLTAKVLPEPVVESFDYAEGSLGGLGAASDGWAAPWEALASGEIDVVDGVMEFPIIPSSGNYIEVLDGGTIFRDLVDTWPDDGGVYWLSLLYQRIDGIDVDDSYNGFSLFINAQELLYIGKPWGTKNLGLDGTGVENVPSEIDAYEGGWLVVKLMMSGDAENDDAYLWIDPDPSVEPDTANADAHVGWKGSDGFNRVRIGSGNTPEQAECAYDEIRIAHSYSSLAVETGVADFTPQAARQFGLMGNYPNPFNPTTNISYVLNETQRTSLTIYDILGRKVCTLVEAVQVPGEYKIQWNGLDYRGQAAPSGIYFYQLVSGDLVKAKKMTLIQ